MILEITLIILLLFISYMLVLSMRRINQYEELILQIQQIITFATDKMKHVDSTGHFEADDEVGTIFKLIKNTVEELKTLKGEPIDAS